jgi:hypothetical protein
MVHLRVRKYSGIAPTFVGVNRELKISGGLSAQLSAGIRRVPSAPIACRKPWITVSIPPGTFPKDLNAECNMSVSPDTTPISLRDDSIFLQQSS